MTFTEQLVQKRSAILDGWFDYILESYHADTARFMRNVKDRFQNPVGSAIRHDIEILYDFVIDEDLSDKLYRFPENIIKIRAVQDFSPSEAVVFVFQLKQALDDVLGQKDNGPERRALDQRIDQLALAGFDEYMRCREKIFEIRIGEVQKKLIGR